MMLLTLPAFDKLRKFLQEAKFPPENLISNSDQKVQISEGDGLKFLNDGAKSTQKKSEDSNMQPLITGDMVQGQHLWVVRSEDVVHAEEQCEFGKKLESKIIKHTNLTGGGKAFSGGEIIFLNDCQIIINGCSGRYGPKSEEEMLSIAMAFSDSGYLVWNMGYDDEANKPLPFLGVDPQFVG
ncbi:hypothetical protein [Janthinobacterium sp. UMAB-60]|uniref:hypothetical protein n=1 Tax=Janthinobacterium sp. UMAB-60 TaxID=1365365 RepID=UPI001C560226|nr:hypothetical protein [Janthinobacterium sp. UMAB-60]